MLNAARVRLALILHRQLHKTNISLLGVTCKCKGDTYWGYDKALQTTGIWPFEETSRDSIHSLLQRLKTFKYKVADKNACIKNCRRNYDKTAQKARLRTEKYFDGLCIDCMNRTKPKLKDHHADFWNYNNFHDEDGWFKGCRVRHKQPSWYYSFMGREEDMSYLLRKHKHSKVWEDYPFL